MRLPLLSCALLLFPAALMAAELKDLRIVFVTDDLRTGRTAAFHDWLAPLAASFSVVTYSRARTPAAAEFAAGDVIMLDWDFRSQEDGSSDGWPEQLARFPNPLGRREAWGKPTVLLGLSGLLLGYTWSVAGDRGCSCLQPLAYDLRDHPMARGPFPIDRSRQVEMPTPEDLRAEIASATITVLPLVDGTPEQAMRLDPGWCTYQRALATAPEVEWICGGVNRKTVTAAAIWRQGNLLHFGFDQAPSALNDTGRRLLANALCYIADFHQDRPIAAQLLGIRGEAYLPARAGVERWLRERYQGNYYPFALTVLAEDERHRVEALRDDPTAFDQWVAQRVPYLHPDGQRRWLEVDGQLLQAATPYDRPAFLALALAGLRSGSPLAVQQLVHRYLPDCPALLAARDQAAWIERRIPWLFPSDAGGYRWYVDQLAFSLGIPSKELRGPARRDHPGIVCDPRTGLCQPE